MNRKLTNFIVGAFALVLSVPNASAQTQLFTNGKENNIDIYWRIPSIVRMNDGTLWAFTDKRYYSAQDLGDADGKTPHKIEIYGRKSFDNGKNWGKAEVALQSNLNASGDNEYLFAFGDASTVVDRESGRILMMAASGKMGVKANPTGQPFVTRSVYDAGKWSTSNVSGQFYGPNNLYGKTLFVTSGRMVQSTKYKKDKYYRIYAGVCMYSKSASYVVYSDDFGKTWQYLGGYVTSPVQDGDECKVEELLNGDILLVTRKRLGDAGRYINVFKFTNIATGAGSWQTSVSTGKEQTNGEAYAAANNGEIMLVPAKSKEGKQTYVLLLSVATNNSNRSNVCIYWKELPTAEADYTNPSNYVSGWTKYQVNNGKYWGYTTMTLDKKGDIAFLSELSQYGGPLSFISLPLSTITNGAYTYHESAKGTYHTSSEPNNVLRPSFDVNGGVYTESKTITINKPAGTTVYYTLDGTDPVVPTTTATTTGAKAPRRAETVTGTHVYSSPITLTEGATTLKAVAVDDYSGNVSETVTASYYITKAEETSVIPASKTGTTISLDYNSATNLYTNNGKGSFWAYLRHNSTHIQLISSTVAELEPGQPIFHVTSNNMTWGSNHLLQLYNGKLNGGAVQQYGHYAIVAPQGYRFLRYKIVMDKSSENGAKLEQYTYQSGSNTEINVIKSATASSDNEVTLERTLSEGSNALYFRMDGQVTGDQNPIVIKTLELTYAIDNPFSAQVPNANGTKIHSGFIDLGTFSRGDGNYGFSNSTATDLETVKAVKSDGTALQNVTSDGDNYFMATADGDYYIEAPAKFRIVGATVNTKRGSVTLGSYENYTPSTSASNKEVIFKNNHNTSYLKIDNTGKGVSTTDISQATKFTINYDGSAYTVMTGGKYLYMIDVSQSSDRASLRLSDSKQTWTVANGHLVFGAKYLICTTGNVWGDTYKSNSSDYPTIQSTPMTYSAGDFKATVYNRENTGVADNGELSVSETSTPSVTVSDMNNDAIHINLSGLSSGSAALFNVSLQLLPLDPEVSSVEAAAKIDNDVVGNSPVTSYNYVFNNGATIGVPVPSTTDKNKAITMVFRKAQNEEQTLWYSTGTNQNNPNVKGGYSNVYLIGSTADATNGLNITSPYPDARTAVDQLGSNAISATNIKQLADPKNTSVNTLQDNTVDATSAGLKDVTMTLATPSYNGGNTFYIYSVDQPTYQIMPSEIATKHVDFRFFTISVKPVVAEKPKIEIVPIYTTTMKGAPHKKSSTLKSDADTPDATHTYVGIKVSAEATGQNTQLYGALTAEDIYTAMTTALKEQYGFKDDLLRGVLYVDMSGLTTVTTSSNTTMAKYASETADNCLYFMPQGFAGAGLGNVISKQSDGSYQSFGDVTVYDQQPFYTPYDFNTGSYKAVYQREGTVKESNTKALVRNMAAVLPFDVHLDEQGHPYLDGLDHAAQHITFRNIRGSGALTGVRKDSNGQPLTYAVVASHVDSRLALANTPYYVTVGKDHDAGFTFNIPGANFTSSAKVAGATIKDEKMLSTNGTWTGHGTYCGGTVSTDPGLWYFSKDLFWKSSLLTNYRVVNVRPFRAYYVTTDQTNAAKAAVVYDNSEIVTTGITNVKGETTHTGKVYTIDGRYVGTSLEGLAPGLYIQDGRKVVKQ